MHLRSIQVFSAILFLLVAFNSQSQTVQMLANGTKTSIRGLSVVNDNVLWASGSYGTVARSTDGGQTFNWITVKGYEQRDFRDIEAFDSNTAIIMAVAEPAIILKTTDAGITWKKVFEDSTKGMFLDAMDFDGKYGVVVGDPIENRAFIAKTNDYGNTWNTVKNSTLLIKDEAFFASSGTNVKQVISRHTTPFTYFVTGGIQSRFFGLYDTPLQMVNSKSTTGANSLACYGDNKYIVVGGDFTNDRDTTANCLLSSDFGKTWQHPQTPPHGYRSCVAFINDNQLITCGTSGVDISNDSGLNWTLISPESFHVCQKAKQGNSVFLAGKDGRIAKLAF
jgi:photosystem II stability/assembly factor-like uncharacterized protein